MGSIQDSLRIQREHRPSIMAVGDDWQSIYSWRGSNPEYLVHFSQYFSNPDPHTYQLTDCYRCSQAILNAAATIIQKVPTTPIARRTEKVAESVAAWRRLPTVPTLHVVESMTSSLAIVTAIQQITTAASESFTTLPDVIDIQCLCATNAALADWSIHSKNARKMLQAPYRLLTPLTIHRAKGLQAHIAIIIGTLDWKSVDEKLEIAWNARGLFPAYADIQRDETYRLGYVAVTRARWGG